MATVLAASVVTVSTATAGNTITQTPAQVNALATAPDPTPKVSSGTPVSLEQAFAASEQPGAQTEVYKAPKGMPQPMVVEGEGGGGGNSCWTREQPKTWGWYPFQMNIHQHTTWCAVYGQYLTYRTTYSKVNEDLSTACSWHNDDQWKVDGGVGNWWVNVKSDSYYDCPTSIPWWTNHYYHSITWEYTASGNIYYNGED